MKFRKVFLYAPCIAAVLALGTACTTVTPTAAPTEILPAATDTSLPPAATPTAIPSTATQPAPTATARPTASPTEIASRAPTTVPLTATVPVSGTLAPGLQVTPGKMAAVVSSEIVNLRSGPSILYAPLSRYPKSTNLELLGKAQGDEWVKVNAPGGKTGWMATDFLTLSQPIEKVPQISVAYSFVVSGTVNDASGAPVPGVMIAVTSFGSNPLRADARTTTEGKFYAYIPPNTTGVWTASVVGLNCKSQQVNAACDLSGNFLQPGSIKVPLPPKGSLSFTFEKTGLSLKGQVTGQDVSGLRVIAQRSDGAEAWGTAATDGSFELPIAAGNWDVYALSKGGGKEGRHVKVTVAEGQAPVTVSVPAP